MGILDRLPDVSQNIWDNIPGHEKVEEVSRETAGNLLVDIHQTADMVQQLEETFPHIGLAENPNPLGPIGTLFEVDTASTGEPRIRPLNDDERALLTPIFGNSINYDEVTLHRGNISHDLGLTAHALGNDIYLPQKYFEKNSQGEWVLTSDGEDLLMHEAGHTWQYQNGGIDYAPDALVEMLEAEITEGTRNGAYVFIDDISNDAPFEELNPEQQAEVIREVGRLIQLDAQGEPLLNAEGDPVLQNHNETILVRDQDGNISHEKITYDSTQLDYFKSAYHLIQEGIGAP